MAGLILRNGNGFDLRVERAETRPRIYKYRWNGKAIRRTDLCVSRAAPAGARCPTT